VGFVAEDRKGVLLGAGAYLAWGLFPLYWPLLDPAGSLEILAHRVVWSLVLVGLLLWVTRRIAVARAVVADRRRLALMSFASVLLSINWLIYIYGVTHDHVVETSLGYFINPIVTVLLGVVVLGERLRVAQWVGVAIAVAAVLVLTVENGRPPWIALALAFSFGGYGLIKKTVGVGSLEGLGVETAVIVPVALVYLGVLAAQGDLAFGTAGPGHALLLAGSGVVTAIPLLMFGAAAGRIPLTTLGLMQYLAPTIQFALGVTLFDEPLPLLRLIGFALVWAGLAVFTADLLRHRRRVQRLAVPEPC
jgi:chloramphenicol-sensitive protein RarD